MTPYLLHLLKDPALGGNLILLSEKYDENVI